MKKRSFKLHLWQQIFIALATGTLVGCILGEDAKPLGYLGIIFLNLIKMVTVPMIMLTIIYGITSIEGSSDLYRISSKAFAIFFMTSSIAVCVGLVVPSFMQPGVGVSPNILNQFKGAANLPKTQDMSVTATLIDLIPSNIFEALTEGKILQIIVFAFIFGAILHSQGDKCRTLINVIQQGALAFFQVINVIMKISPFGVFGYIASIVGTEGLTLLFSLGKLFLTITIGCICHYFCFALLIVLLTRLSPVPFLKKILAAQLLAFGTSSSKATLVPLMEIAEKKLGISRQNSRFLLPLSAALNMDGGAIYQASCTIFFAQMLGVDFSVTQYVTLFFMCTLASIGGAGIPGGVLLFLGMVLHSVGLPVEGVLLIATIDRLLDMITTVVNITGCACVTLIVDGSEKTLNVKTYYSKK